MKWLKPFVWGKRTPRTRIYGKYSGDCSPSKAPDNFKRVLLAAADHARGDAICIKVGMVNDVLVFDPTDIAAHATDSTSTDGYKAWRPNKAVDAFLLVDTRYDATMQYRRRKFPHFRGLCIANADSPVIKLEVKHFGKLIAVGFVHAGLSNIFPNTDGTRTNEPSIVQKLVDAVDNQFADIINDHTDGMQFRYIFTISAGANKCCYGIGRPDEPRTQILLASLQAEHPDSPEMLGTATKGGRIGWPSLDIVKFIELEISRIVRERNLVHYILFDQQSESCTACATDSTGARRFFSHSWGEEGRNLTLLRL